MNLLNSSDVQYELMFVELLIEGEFIVESQSVDGVPKDWNRLEEWVLDWLLCDSVKDISLSVVKET